MTREAAVRADPREPTRARVRHRKGDADSLWVDLTKKPDEQDWNWKRNAVHGQQDRQNLTLMAESGWEPVDAAVFGSGQVGPVERDGMILVERPVELTMEAQAEDAARARGQVSNTEAQFKQATHTQDFDPRSNPKTRPMIKKSFGSLEVAE